MRLVRAVPAVFLLIPPPLPLCRFADALLASSAAASSPARTMLQGLKQTRGGQMLQAAMQDGTSVHGVSSSSVSPPTGSQTSPVLCGSAVLASPPPVSTCAHEAATEEAPGARSSSPNAENERPAPAMTQQAWRPAVGQGALGVLARRG